MEKILRVNAVIRNITTYNSQKLNHTQRSGISGGSGFFISKFMNYIKIYENHTRHAVPVGYEIHHIDHNRENNEIQNLVLLPDTLHRAYHNSKMKIEQWELNFLLKMRNDFVTIGNTELKNFLEILDKCNAFVRLRDCLINGENYIGGFESFLKTNKVFEIYNEIYPF